MFARVSSLFLLPLWISLSLAHSKNPKRGIGYAGTVPGDVINANQTNSVITWDYNWANIPPDYLATANLEYIPMQWGSVGVDSFASDVQAQGVDTILTFNEPDFVDESDILPQDAANLWMQFIQPLKAQGIRLGGPAVTASPTGLPWLQAFFKACTNCTIDFLPLHWYGEGVEAFYGYIWSIHGEFPQYPIWITEYAETSTNTSGVLDFMNQTITYMDTLTWIERYSWFGYFRPRPNITYNMLTDDGALNALGQLYTEANTVHTENVTAAPTPTYNTVNGADNPTQLPATTWPVLFNSAYKARGSIASGLQLSFLVISLTTGFFGFLLTMW